MSLLEIVKTRGDKFKEEYPKLKKNAEYKVLKNYDPKLDEINQVYNIIKTFIIEKKRKVYGGYALNLLLKQKDKNLAIYDDVELTQADIEYYSSTPIEDLIELCGQIYKAGFKPVSGQEAQHPETYTIFVNYRKYCDITYIPNNINKKTRFITIENMNLIHPWFMMIDYFRMFTDPLTSYWRLEKTFDRYKLIEKTYPLPLIQKPLNMTQYKDKKISDAINLLFDYLSEKNTILFTGFYVYNYYLYKSEYKKYNFEILPYLEVYSTDYIKDGLDIVEYIKNLPEEISKKLSHKEYYPFFQFYGYNTVVYYNDGKDSYPILYLYSNNKRCIPYKQTEYIKFDNLNITKPIVKKDQKINIGCFDHNILHGLIILVKLRVDEDNDWNDVLYKYINGLVTFRNNFLEKNKKTIYDDSIFQGFVIDCMGEPVFLDRERRLLIEIRKKLGKPYTFKYEPSSSKIPKKFSFPNSSGNEITNDAKLKLKKENLDKQLIDDLEGDEIENTDSEDKGNNKSTQTETETETETESDSIIQINSLETTETTDGTETTD
jgi:hypothetical protein